MPAPIPVRLLFLAMDAGERLLLRRWAADGTLPVLRSLLEAGLTGDTVSVDGLYEGATWPSICTGCSPARHGFHSLTLLEPGTYEFRRADPAAAVRRPPFWEALSRAGRRVAILDIPLTAPRPGLNGIQMVEWGSHDGVYGFHARPAGLRREVIGRFGRHPWSRSCNGYGRSPQDFLHFRDRLIEGVRSRAELTIHYLKRGPWDFFAQVFSESHCVGHQCWHLHDPRHPGHDPEAASITGDPIRLVYQEIDRALGRILDSVDGRTTVIFLASHGMAAAAGADFLLPEILVRLGRAARRHGDAPGPPPGLLRRAYGLARGVWEGLPKPARSALQGALRPLHGPLWARLRRSEPPNPPAVAVLDPARSPCFPLVNGNPVSGIRVNVAGREPGGLIEPGRPLDDFCAGLATELGSLVNCRTGRPAARRIWRERPVAGLPDLLIEWDDAQPLGGAVENRRLRLYSENTGLVEGTYNHCRSGEHRPQGLFAVTGPGIRPARLQEPVSVMDFAPTIGSLLGVRLGEVDGRPIGEVVGEAR